ncbi:MAG: ribosome silencing factor [bacterium]|nr:ribosome silencing factor [bacterium]
MQVSDNARMAADALAEVKGGDIVVIDVEKNSSIADYFVIATGDSSVHMRAMADRVRQAMASHGSRISHGEGRESQNWILLDFNTVIVHIFSKNARNYYGLENLWGDADMIGWNEREREYAHP